MELLQAFLNSQAVKDALNRSKSPLAAITVLKKICVHPNLLSERAVDAVAKGGKPAPLCEALMHVIWWQGLLSSVLPVHNPGQF